jgi:hypothetical protein
MTTYKFAVGQAVSFSPDRGQLHTRGETFTIVGLLPLTGDALQYRIKGRPTATSGLFAKTSLQFGHDSSSGVDPRSLA